MNGHIPPTRVAGQTLLFLALLPAGLCISAPEAADWKTQGVVSTARTARFRLQSVPIRSVKMGSGFWTDRMETIRTVSIPTLLHQLEDHGVVDNFRRLSGRKKVERRGPLYTDSDLYKWIEAAAHVLQWSADRALRQSLDAMIDEVAAAQEKDGYLNTYFALERASLRWTDFRSGHELYCLGHLIQAGIAHYRATGESRLVNVARRFADYVVERFGPKKKPAYTGHPEAELAFVELYRTTGERKYLDFANYLLLADRQPTMALEQDEIEYAFSGIPFTERKIVEGHSVRCMYASAGAADLFAETGQVDVWDTLQRLWTDLTSGKMYLTGGLGSREAGEAIGNTYELPNEQAYTETCAAIGNFMWNWRLLLLTGDARYADLAERILYNGALSGLSLSGDHYFYRNPLESRGDFRRRPWYNTTCCPPNIQRTLGSLPGYLYSTNSDGFWLNLYHQSVFEGATPSGKPVRLSQSTRYPWELKVEVSVGLDSPESFGLFLRVPGWSSFTSARINGRQLDTPTVPGSYLALKREWRDGDRITLELDKSVRVIQANPRVRENLDRVAVEWGPLVYCAEAIDLPEPVSLFDIVLMLEANPATGFQLAHRLELLGGVTVLETTAAALSIPAASRPLYYGFEQPDQSPRRSIQIILIPYYAWANRQPSDMQVWFPWRLRTPAGH